MTKVIFTKDYEHYDITNLYHMKYNKGAIAKAHIIDGGYVIDHIWFGGDTVITLSEYREQQINDILYDDIEG